MSAGPSIPEVLRWWVYEPIDWQRSISYREDMERCRASVPGRGVIFTQCGRKPKGFILGIGFCTQHAKKIRAALGDKIVEAR